MPIPQPRRRIALLAFVASLVAAPATGAPLDAPVQTSPRQLELLERSSPPTRSWMSSDVASSTAQLIYASLITSISTGQTNVYEVAGDTLKLVGQLPVGGGPIAVDRSQNVWVSDVGGNFMKWNARTVYEFARGATKPKRVLRPNLVAWNIAVAYDGTVYVAGPSRNGQHLGSMVRYAPGATAGTSLAGTFGALEAGRPTGMAVDAAGDLFAGWQTAGGTPQCGFVCVLKLDAGATSWQTLLATNGAANHLSSGPFLDANGNVVVFNDDLIEQLMLLFAPGQLMPNRVAVIPPVTPTLSATVLDGTGTSLWGENTLLNTTQPYAIFRFDYPSTRLSLMFEIPQKQPSISPDEGIAVSPSFYP